MKKTYLALLTATLVLSLGVCSAYGAKPVDNDNDGYKSNVDCNDNNPDVFPGAPELCDDIDNQCPGDVGYGEVDEGCANPHSDLVYSEYPSNCMTCHDQSGVEGSDQYDQMWNSTHYKWVGDTTEMTNQPGTVQGKLTNAINSYCINIEGDWPVCGSCHAGRGIKPGTTDTKANIDCLICHNAAYAAKRTRLPSGANGPAVDPAAKPPVEQTDPAVLNTYVQNIAKPTRANCLKCHAKAGGGDGVKRGDLSLATATNADANFDVHMNTAASDVQCQDCHVFQNHKTIGRGSDIRPTDDTSRGAEVSCETCHDNTGSGWSHSTAGKRGEPDRHIARVACQSCHIPTYAKWETEVHRDWTHHHDGTPADGVSGPGHPHTDKLANLTPEYLFWNRLSDNYLLGDDAGSTYDPVKDTYPTSRPKGDINDGKLYPFKYKTADQPIIRGGDCDGQLLVLDTFEYLKVSGNVDTAIDDGLANMGCPPIGGDVSVEWITTDTYQLINHGVNPAASVADCSQCHGSGNLDLATDSMLDAMGYRLKGDKETEVCNQCHAGTKKLPRTHERMHNHINKGSGIGCAFCHSFSRPERPGCQDPADQCADEFLLP